MDKETITIPRKDYDNLIEHSTKLKHEVWKLQTRLECIADISSLLDESLTYKLVVVDPKKEDLKK